MKVKIYTKNQKKAIEVESLQDLTYGKMNELVINHGRDPISKIDIVVENKDNYLGSDAVGRKDIEEKWAGLGSQLTELSHRSTSFGNKIKINVTFETYTKPRSY